MFTHFSTRSRVRIITIYMWFLINISKLFQVIKLTFKLIDCFSKPPLRSIFNNKKVRHLLQMTLHHNIHLNINFAFIKLYILLCLNLEWLILITHQLNLNIVCFFDFLVNLLLNQFIKCHVCINRVLSF